MRMLVKVCFGIYLLILSAKDIKDKEIPLGLLALGLVFAPLSVLTDEREVIYVYLLGVLPGIAFLLVSFISRGQIGQADAFVLICVGLCNGIEAVIAVISVSLVAIALVSMVMLILGRLNRKSTLPYIPFVLLGYVLYLFVT